jgi:hypothetical protein
VSVHIGPHSFVKIALFFKLKLNVQLTLCLTKHHAMKAYWGVEVELHAFLISALAEVSGQLHAPAALPPGKEPLVPIR